MTTRRRARPLEKLTELRSGVAGARRGRRRCTGTRAGARTRSPPRRTRRTRGHRTRREGGLPAPAGRAGLGAGRVRGGAGAVQRGPADRPGPPSVARRPGAGAGGPGPHGRGAARLPGGAVPAAPAPNTRWNWASCTSRWAWTTTPAASTTRLRKSLAASRRQRGRRRAAARPLRGRPRRPAAAAVRLLKTEWQRRHTARAVADALGWALHRSGDSARRCSTRRRRRTRAAGRRCTRTTGA